MALLDFFFLSRKKNTANIAKNDCKSSLRSVVVATPSLTTCRSCARTSEVICKCAD